jgi:multicomponent Na+:H+ antiporter subunit A
MWMGPVVLGGITIVFGIIPGWVAHWLVQPAVRVFYGSAVYVKLSLYHGINVPLILSILTLTTGALLYIFRRGVYRWLSKLDIQPLFIFDNLYEAHIRAIQAVAEAQTRILQNGSLHRYMSVTVITATLGIGTALYWFSPPIALPASIAVEYREWAVILMIVMGVLTLTFSRSRLTGICALGVSGAGIALLFMMLGAPDLALTQLLVETLTVIIVSVVLLRLPVLGDTRRGFLGIRWADAAISAAAGVVFAWLILGTSQMPFDRFITDFFEAKIYIAARGRNIVNVILVDFRGLDTMGEITVVAVAGLAAFTLIRSATAQDTSTPFTSSIILRTATRMLVGLILIFSVYLLFRGHHEPGGGFAGALVAATGFALFAISEGPDAVLKAIRVEPRHVIFTGLLLALGAGVAGMIAGKPFMTGLWGDIPVGANTHFALSTPLVFDIGVYITVIGAVLTLVLALEEDIA